LTKNSYEVFIALYLLFNNNQQYQKEIFEKE
jgi:hypothetical protein